MILGLAAHGYQTQTISLASMQIVLQVHKAGKDSNRVTSDLVGLLCGVAFAQIVPKVADWSGTDRSRRRLMAPLICRTDNVALGTSRFQLNIRDFADFRRLSVDLWPYAPQVVEKGTGSFNSRCHVGK